MNVRQLELMCEHFDFLITLAKGARAPTTEAQKHFVAVCRGKAKPQTEYEKAYLAWRKERPSISQMLARKDRLLGLAPAEKRASPHPQQDNTDLIAAEKRRQARAAARREAEPKEKKENFTRRYVEESWGSREAWKRDRSQNRFNGR
jgi:uncharacterized protein YifE (UPF0438 family)